jgi:K+-transporting ATPase KdpF subunit
MILALAMSGEDLAGIVISALVLVYLVYALVYPEKL